MYSGRNVRCFNVAARDVQLAFQHCKSPAVLVTAKKKKKWDGGEDSAVVVWTAVPLEIETSGSVCVLGWVGYLYF